MGGTSRLTFGWSGNDTPACRCSVRPPVDLTSRSRYSRPGVAAEGAPLTRGRITVMETALADAQTTKSVGDTTERVSRASLKNERIRVLGRRDPAAVEAGTPLGDAIRAMQEQAGGDSVMVNRDGRLAGILTERDILLKVLGQDVDLGAPVDDFMTADPETLSPDDTVGAALNLMERGHYRHVPLVDDGGRLCGMLRLVDVLLYVAEAFPQEVLNLPPRPHQKMQEPEGA